MRVIIMQKLIKFFSTIFIVTTLSLNAMSEEVKHQAIPVGMFNVYPREEGNLGLPTPDLREVWDGMSTDWGGGYYPYEACNLVQHYWTGSLPNVPSGQDANAAWWINYLRQVYEAGNEDNPLTPFGKGDGEVRLRAIVGALYEPYNVYGETWLINFIKALCEWEQSGPQNGVIAGWYLAEEPMGSTHNYDPNVFDDMIDAIEYVESEGGYRRHDRYVDVALGGAYYSPQNLIRFTRGVDVVMISGGTFLWQASGAPPIYYPKWENIHINLYHARNLIYPDRDRNGLPRPKIHVVLEVYDTKGYGQPTNWEIRQQIRTALSPDIKIYGKTSEPADGVWFFWWPGLTFQNDERVSDWVFGRRVAEAIEMEIAEMTGNRREFQSQNMPTRSRFVFPNTGAFNPDESAIPYELAEPGKVRIEVLDANMTLIDEFEMGVQSAGLLHHFGGPRWTLGSYEPDGQYVFRLYVDSILMDTARVEVQSRPGLNSPSHILGAWSKENVVKVTWRPPALNSGLRGFSYLWNTTSSSYPDQTVNLSRSARELESEPLPDGNSHYFHLRSVDNDENWSLPAHLGPFYIDTTPPSPVTGLVSASHSIGQSNWSTNNTIDISWMPAQDATSGLRGYSYLWDTYESTLPPEDVNLGWAVTAISSEPLPDGQWYFHIRSVDVAGNWNSEAKHFGPFCIDTQPPGPPNDLTSSSHQVAVWSNQNEISLSWQPAEDEGSGISGYLTLWDTSEDTALTRDTHHSSLITHHSSLITLSDGNNHYFHLRSMDKAGQLSEETLHLGPFYIDATPPGAVKELMLFDQNGQAHNPQDWLTDGNIRLQWQHAEDEGSGIAEYVTVLKMNGVEWKEGARGQEGKGARGEGGRMGQEYTPTASLPDGEWIFQIRAQDAAGNLGGISEISVRIDSYIATLKVSSPSHPDSEKWYSDNSPTITWDSPSETSGIAGYSFIWDNSPLTVPDETLDLPGDATSQNPTSPLTPLSTSGEGEGGRGLGVRSDGVWYFHLKAYDNAGNVSETAHYKVQIDASVPKTPIIISDTHPVGKWISNRNIQFKWSPAEPVNLSGISDVSFLVDNNPTSEPSIPPLLKGAGGISQSVEKDGVWYIHLKVQSGAGLWSQTAHYEVRIDTTRPQLILSSPTHPNSDQWYTDNSPTMTWNIVETETSGIAGYSFVWDNSPLTVPDETLDLPGDATSQNPTSPLTPLSTSGEGEGGRGLGVRSDGVWYFHLKAYDNAGNISETVHYKVQIDASVPKIPTIISDTHPVGKWVSNRNIQFRWSSAEPVNLSGISGVSFLVDNNPTNVPDEISSPIQNSEIRNPKSEILSQSVEKDGIWYIHLKVQSGAGLWSQTAHYEIRIDTTKPQLILSSPTHPNSDQWYTDNSPTMTWKIVWEVADTSLYTSGIAGYSFVWDNSPLTVPDETLDLPGDATSQNPTSPLTPLSTSGEGEGGRGLGVRSDGVWYFHLKAYDNAGNVSETAHYKIQIDSAMPAVPKVRSLTHPAGQWTSNSTLELNWQPPVTASGITGYSFLLDHNQLTVPDEKITENVTSKSFANLRDGIWYFHLKAQSATGLWSNTANYEVRVDTELPLIEIHFPQSDRWYNESITEYYGQARDEVSGIDWNTLEYRYGNLEWKRFSRNVIPSASSGQRLSESEETDEATNSWRDTDEIPHTSEAEMFPTLEKGGQGGLIFQVRVRDLAGNLGVSAPTILRVDSGPPKLNLMSPTHPDQQVWYLNNQPVIIFYGNSETSGISGYSWNFDQQSISSPPEIIMQTENQATFRIPSDNSWYFHLKAQDGAGNWSETYHYKLNIDTTSPRAQIELPSLNSEIRNPNSEFRVGTGKLSISLTLSEPLPEGNTPKLYYQTSNKRRVPLGLKVPQFRIPNSKFQIPVHWEAVTHIDMWTGDGTAEFFFEATDKAGNVGTEITEGKFFVIDTLLRKDSTEIQYVSDEIAQVTLSIPPGALKQDMRIKIDSSDESMSARIKNVVLRAFDVNFHELSDTTFKKLIEMSIGFSTTPAKSLSQIPQLFYSDGAKTHQIGGAIKDNTIAVRVNHLGTFEIVLSEPVKKKIAHGWAAPNPFTPNGSGDGTDRTIFHAATRDNNIQFTIKIFDLNGRLVRTLENNNNVWDGRDERGRVVEGGLYIYQILSGEEVISGTVVVVK
jgi:hypothetical protein